MDYGIVSIEWDSKENQSGVAKMVGLLTKDADVEQDAWQEDVVVENLLRGMWMSSLGWLEKNKKKEDEQTGDHMNSGLLP